MKKIKFPIEKNINCSESLAGSEMTIFNVTGAGRAVSQPAK
jgi:hypothetical protein